MVKSETVKALDKLSDPTLDLGVKDWDKELVSSGILTVDLATQRGGLPRGEIIDFYGNPALGKTTCALTMCAERMRQGEQCVYIDVEHRLFSGLRDLVIGPDKSLFKQLEPATGDAALRQLEKACAIPGVRMVVFDSLAALVMEAQMDPENKVLGLSARETTLTIKRILSSIYKYGTIVIIINQIRDNPMPKYGQPSTTVTGGRALKFFASLRMNIHKAGLEKEGNEVVGQRVRIELEKNSFDKPFGEARPVLMYGIGIDRDRDIMETAKSLGMIEQKASWLSYTDQDGEIRGHGEKELLLKLNEKLPAIQASIHVKIREQKEKELAAPTVQEAQSPEAQPTEQN